MNTRKMSLRILVALVALLLIKCGTPSTSIPTTEPSVQPTTTPIPSTTTRTTTPTVTSSPTHTFTPTNSPLPTNTPTITTTPTITSTPTRTATLPPTSTPFKTSNCRDLKLNITESTTDEQVEAQLKAFHGRCVRLYYDTSDGYLSTDFMWIFFFLEVKIDKDAPPGVRLPTNYSSVYGIFLAQNQQPQNVSIDTLLLRQVEELPSIQSPIRREGLYMVGKEREIAPGSWKSGIFATWTDSCYWARLNPDTGAIKDNHFGIGGITVKLYEGDVFETNDSCLPWFYVGP